MFTLIANSIFSQGIPEKKENRANIEGIQPNDQITEGFIFEAIKNLEEFVIRLEKRSINLQNEYTVTMMKEGTQAIKDLDSLVHAEPEQSATNKPLGP